MTVPPRHCRSSAPSGPLVLRRDPGRFLGPAAAGTPSAGPRPSAYRQEPDRGTRVPSLQAARGGGGRGHARGGACASDRGNLRHAGARGRWAWAREGRGLRALPCTLRPGGSREAAAGGFAHAGEEDERAAGPGAGRRCAGEYRAPGRGGVGAAGLGAGGARLRPSAVRVRAAFCFASSNPLTRQPVSEKTSEQRQVAEKFCVSLSRTRRANAETFGFGFCIWLASWPKANLNKPTLDWQLWASFQAVN